MLQIEITKRADRVGLLRCTRADGSVTWQKQTAHNAPFYALHDMTHYAVETALGYRRGFFGLVAEGWEIEDTTGKGARGELPPEALEVERLVALFDSERGCGARWTRDDFNKFSPRDLTQCELQSVRELRAELFARWAEVEPGQKLELTFAVPSAVAR